MAFHPWIDDADLVLSGDTANCLTESSFSLDNQRKKGFVGGTPASALRVNAGLRQANLVAAALMKALNLDSNSLSTSVVDLTANITAALKVRSDIFTGTYDTSEYDVDRGYTAIIYDLDIYSLSNSAIYALICTDLTSKSVSKPYNMTHLLYIVNQSSTSEFRSYTQIIDFVADRAEVFMYQYSSSPVRVDIIFDGNHMDNWVGSTIKLIKLFDLEGV